MAVLVFFLTVAAQDSQNFIFGAGLVRPDTNETISDNPRLLSDAGGVSPCAAADWRWKLFLRFPEWELFAEPERTRCGFGGNFLEYPAGDRHRHV
jgi:hypothetical protein